jgi:hypothetical protein
MHHALQILGGHLVSGQIISCRLLIGPLAHSGHGPVDANHPAHYLTAPEHLVVVVAIVACVVIAGWFAARTAYRISKPT